MGEQAGHWCNFVQTTFESQVGDIPQSEKAAVVQRVDQELKQFLESEVGASKLADSQALEERLTKARNELAEVGVGCAELFSCAIVVGIAVAKIAGAAAVTAAVAGAGSLLYNYITNPTYKWNPAGVQCTPDKMITDFDTCKAAVTKTVKKGTKVEIEKWKQGTIGSWWNPEPQGCTRVAPSHYDNNMLTIMFRGTGGGKLESDEYALCYAKSQEAVKIAEESKKESYAEYALGSNDAIQAFAFLGFCSTIFFIYKWAMAVMEKGESYKEIVAAEI